MARPTKYTEETIMRLEQAIAMGSTFKLACGYAGITEETLSQWRKTKPGFTERLTRAEASAALRWLEKIEQAGDEDWRAAAWKLERRHPEEYGKTVKVDLEARIRLLAEQLGLNPDDALREAEQVLQEARRGATR